MKYRVSLEGIEREVDVVLSPSGRATVTLDGQPVDADIERVPGGVSVRLGGRVFDVAVGGAPDAPQVAAGAARGVASVISERALARAKKSGSLHSGGKELRAPMPGRVVRVLVKAGQEVDTGTPCVVVEAMKMENELLAPNAAKVAAIHVDEGASVEGQALLVSFE
jgi:biotin carboxyl carrier protein